MDNIWGSFIVSGAIDELREEIAYPRRKREAEGEAKNQKQWLKYYFFECDSDQGIGKGGKIYNTFSKGRLYGSIGNVLSLIILALVFCS